MKVETNVKVERRSESESRKGKTSEIVKESMQTLKGKIRKRKKIILKQSSN